MYVSDEMGDDHQLDEILAFLSTFLESLMLPSV